MFTGIITQTGKLTEKQGSVFRFNATRKFSQHLKSGDSLAVNGVCLTLLNTPVDGSLQVEIMTETARRTTLGNLKPNERVNLELPATAATFLSGHIVQGHVDAVGQIETIKAEGKSHILTISLPAKMTQYVVEKGSICVNGISLTVMDIGALFFRLGIIPYTWSHTMLSQIQVGDCVNIEADIIAKYVEKNLERSQNYERIS